MGVRIRGTVDDRTGLCVDFPVTVPDDDPLYLLDMASQAEDKRVWGGYVGNTWSEAARDAAELARKASAKAVKHSGYGERLTAGASDVQGDHAALAHAAAERADHFAGTHDHGSAAAAHEAAAFHHDAAVKDHAKFDGKEQHDTARGAHADATYFHRRAESAHKAAATAVTEASRPKRPTGNVENKKPSYFGDCERDAKGHCEVGADGKPVPAGKDSKPATPGGKAKLAPAQDAVPAKLKEKGNVEYAAEHEILAARRLSLKKIRAAPVPGPDKVVKMRKSLKASKDYDRKAKVLKDQGHTKAEIKAKLGNPPRAGGDARGSSKDRKARAKKLFTEFGGDDAGYVVCHGTGMKMHWTSDKKANPGGYPCFEQGKIFTAFQGGGYQHPNLLPESKTWNRGRNDKAVRKENLT
jgi:hypothetical protein